MASAKTIERIFGLIVKYVPVDKVRPFIDDLTKIGGNRAIVAVMVALRARLELFLPTHYDIPKPGFYRLVPLFISNPLRRERLTRVVEVKNCEFADMPPRVLVWARETTDGPAAGAGPELLWKQNDMGAHALAKCEFNPISPSGTQVKKDGGRND